MIDFSPGGFACKKAQGIGYAFKEVPPELEGRGLRAAVLAATIGGAAVRLLC